MKAIEDFDQKLLGTLREGLQSLKEYRLLLLPDHTTSTLIRTHTHDPVPFVASGSGVKANHHSRFTELEAEKSKVFVQEGYTLMGKFLKGEI